MNSIKKNISFLRGYIKRNYFTPKNQQIFLDKMEKTQSIFIHIPKTGGKTILNSFYGMEEHESFGHTNILFYKSIFGTEKFNLFFKFAFVRNPWDRTYSAFSFAKAGGFGFSKDKELAKKISHLSFEKFIQNCLSQDFIKDQVIFRPQHQFICDLNGEPLTNQVFYFEKFESECSLIKEKLGLYQPVSKKNESIRKKDFREAYNNVMAKKVNELYHRDIELFNYPFPF